MLLLRYPVAAVVLAVASSAATRPQTTHDNPPDSLAIRETVEAFHTALARSDSSAALALLTADARILESGDQETKAEYAAHHLAADMEFSRAVPSQQLGHVVQQEGSVAWVASISTSRGTFRGRPVASQGAELMVLTKVSGSWRIRAIHWSSRRL